MSERSDIDALFADGSEIERGLKKAVGLAVLEHKRAGNPIVEWRNGRVVWVPPEEIEVEEE